MPAKHTPVDCPPRAGRAMSGWQPRVGAGLRSLRRFAACCTLAFPRFTNFVRFLLLTRKRKQVLSSLVRASVPASSLCDNLSLAGPSPLYWSAGGQTRATLAAPPFFSSSSAPWVSPVSFFEGRPATLFRDYRRRSRSLDVDREHLVQSSDFSILHVPHRRHSRLPSLSFST